VRKARDIAPHRGSIENSANWDGAFNDNERPKGLLCDRGGFRVSSSADKLCAAYSLCPRSDESAGKRRSSRIRHCAPWLETTLVQCAWAAIRVKDSYLRAQYYRLRGRVGPMKAIIAVAASMLTSVFHMLTQGSEYRELTGAYFDRRDHAKLAKRLVRRLEDLGLKVTVSQAA